MAWISRTDRGPAVHRTRRMVSSSLVGWTICFGTRQVLTKRFVIVNESFRHSPRVRSVRCKSVPNPPTDLWPVLSAIGDGKRDTDLHHGAASVLQRSASCRGHGPSSLRRHVGWRAGRTHRAAGRARRGEPCDNERGGCRPRGGEVLRGRRAVHAG